MDKTQQMQQQQSQQLNRSDKLFFSTLNKVKKDLTLSPQSSSLQPSLPATSTENDHSQRRASWKTSLSRKLTKLRPKHKKESQESEKKQPSFSYTTRDDNLTQFGQPRTQVFKELPPLHFSHFLNSKPTSPSESLALSITETTSGTTSSLKDQNSNQVDQLVHLLCVGDADSSPTFMKYSSVVTKKNETAPPIENNNLKLNSLPATRPSLCVIQNTCSDRAPRLRPRSLYDQNQHTLQLTHNELNRNRTTSEKPRFCDIHKIQPSYNNENSLVKPLGLYRRASDGFSKRRVLSFHDDMLQQNQQQHSNFQQLHPWTPTESRSTSPSSDLTAISSRSSRSASSASSSASSLSSWSSTGSSTTIVERHPEALRSDWKNLRLSMADSSGSCDVSERDDDKDLYTADVNAIYAIANEIGCHRMREHRTVMQLRQMRARNRARWEFESLPRVHIALPLPPAGSLNQQSRNDVRRNSFLYAYSYTSDEADSSVMAAGAPVAMGTPGSSGSMSRTINARIGRVNARIRHKVISHQVHFPAAVALPPSLTNSGSATSSLGEPTVVCQTRTARFKLMRSSSAAYLYRTVQGCGTVLPKGQFMAKLILLNRKHPVGMSAAGHVLRDVDGVQRQSYFDQQNQQQLMMRGINRMSGKATVSTATPQLRCSSLTMGSGIGGGTRKLSAHWNLSTDVLTVMPTHATPPLRRLASSQARRQKSSLRKEMMSFAAADATLPNHSDAPAVRVFRPTRSRPKSFCSMRAASCMVSHDSNVISCSSTPSGQRPRHPLREFIVPEIAA